MLLGYQLGDMLFGGFCAIDVRSLADRIGLAVGPE
jgi:hypothetical protein